MGKRREQPIFVKTEEIHERAPNLARKLVGKSFPLLGSTPKMQCQHFVFFSFLDNDHSLGSVVAAEV